MSCHLSDCCYLAAHDLSTHPPPLFPSQVMPIFDTVAKNMAAEGMGTQEEVPDIQVRGGWAIFYLDLQSARSA